MGFLDKLLGRNKDSAPETDAFIGDERRTDPAEPSLDEAEERATEARDETLGIENRVPPGTG
jgi:hypothetical protein